MTPMTRITQTSSVACEEFCPPVSLAMPETKIPLKINASVPLTRSTTSKDPDRPIEKNLARCVRRKLQYLQVPVKCQRASPYHRSCRIPIANRTPTANPAKSCPDNSPCTPNFGTIGTFLYKKSSSMIDLSPLNADSELADLRSDSNLTPRRHEDLSDRAKEILGSGLISLGTWVDGSTSSESEESGRFSRCSSRAASVVCHALILNAWRRRRAEVVQLREVIDHLGQQIEHLHIQIAVLRRLLDTENGRIGRLTDDVRRAKMQLDDAARERDTLKTEKGKIEEDLRRQCELSEERMVMVENLKNELNTARDQLEALDAQIARDREKLLKLREDKRILLDKVSASDALATERAARAEKAETTVEELKIRLAAQVALAESAQEQVQKYLKDLKTKEEEKSRLEKRLKSTEETGRSLSLRTITLENQIVDRETALRRIESAYSIQMMELHELRERFIRQSQESGWSNRMLQFANTIVRVPRAILRTLFLSGAPSPS